MTATQTVRIFEVLNKHFKNADDARTAVEQIEMIVEKKVDKHRENLTTKDDLHLLEKKISGDSAALEKKISGDIFQLEKKLSGEIHALELRLTTELQSTKSDIQKLELRVNDNISAAKVEQMRWMLGTFIPLMLAILGLYFKA
ncbi:MAG: hypothetical protein INR69_20615 [Mucilaginibacter polytrichastri]|nr:hypothetical protein [Mucilaginibacter polytrichastri]